MVTTKPMSFLHFFRRWIRCKTSQQRKTLWQIYAFESLQLPVIYTDQHGLRYVLYPGQNAQVYFENQGNYEVAETRFCLDFIRPGMVTFDVGANIGLYTLLFAKLAGSSGQVHSFEPETQNYDRLVTNITLNGFKHVTANQNAVFSVSKPLQLNVFSDQVNAWHSLGRPVLPDPFHPGEEIAPIKQQSVPGISLDDYCALAGISRIDLLKIDVEGAELDVLQGAAQMLREGRITAVMFEISLPQIQAMGHNPEDVVSLLINSGMKIFAFSTSGQLVADINPGQTHYQNFVAIKDPEALNWVTVVNV